MTRHEIDWIACLALVSIGCSSIDRAGVEEVRNDVARIEAERSAPGLRRIAENPWVIWYRAEMSRRRDPLLATARPQHPAVEPPDELVGWAVELEGVREPEEVAIPLARCGGRLVVAGVPARIADALAGIDDNSVLSAAEKTAHRQALFEAEMRIAIEEAILLERAQRAGFILGSARIEIPVREAIRDSGGIDAFRRLLAQEGRTIEDFRREVAVERARQAYVWDRIARDPYLVHVGDDEVEAFYEAHPDLFRLPARAQIQQLLFPPPDRRARQEAERTAARLRRGDDLVSLARQARGNWEIPESWRHDSDVVDGEAIWIEEGSPGLRPAVAEAAFGMAEGEVSGPIEVPLGVDTAYLVVRVRARSPTRRRPLREVAGSIRAHLVGTRFQSISDHVLTPLRERIGRVVDRLPSVAEPDGIEIETLLLPLDDGPAALAGRWIDGGAEVALDWAPDGRLEPRTASGH